ncbi:NAD(P)/FAD-dependent oxidoreductase [Pseudoprimorskyibacter insulae]|uniref:4-methylaminobutanoate oxidase (Formaldehyde-forming) n=1 Tax=Pseudoprimorskyibacter insulae TaxID=1695997 RepID=A0A2R8AXA2_9RHOB|nr:FAD-binding oxidoreductase [Pseudoprimorskyibacter insulae]SPF80577.1 4-methylaminobutanoate oxidase (formaldehyde-forming) [Pseudoprimorskyibacter insulae]
MTSGFPIHEGTPVQFDAPLPEAVDFAVIGGGVIGVSTALHLARKGHRVVLLEKGRIAGEQSSRNWGWIRQQGRDPHELPIMIEANRIWKDLATQTNVDIGLKTIGVTYLAKTQEDLENYASWLPHAEAHGLDTRLYAGADMARAFPELAGSGYAGILHTPSDMKGEPWVAVPALAGIAKRDGAIIIENCAVRTLDIQAGRVTGVVTERGTIRAPEVILAGGAWSGLFLRNHGIQIPQLSVRSSVAATAPINMPTDMAAVEKTFAFRARSDGGVTLAPGAFHELFIGPSAVRHAAKYKAQFLGDPTGTRFVAMAPRGYPDAWTTPRRWTGDIETPFERMRILNPKPNMKRLKRAAERLQAMFPEIGPVRLETAWAGMIDVMPDVVPVIDRANGIQGLTIGTGMCGHGFGIGPGMGRVLADLASGGDVGHDLTRFRLSRFSDGSPIELGPQL